jgi:hypothetical protein
VLTTLAVYFLTVLLVFVRQAFQKMAGRPESAEKVGRLRRLLSLRRA